MLKNYAISKTTNNWILSLDAGEVIPTELKKEMEEVLKNPKFDGYYFPRKSYIGKMGEACRPVSFTPAKAVQKGKGQV